MYALSKLFDFKYVRYWSSALHKYNWNQTQQNQIKDKIFQYGKTLGLRNEFAQEWAELGPWNT